MRKPYWIVPAKVRVVMVVRRVLVVRVLVERLLLERLLLALLVRLLMLVLSVLLALLVLLLLVAVVVVHTLCDIDPDELANMSRLLAFEWIQATPQSFWLNDAAYENM